MKNEGEHEQVGSAIDLDWDGIDCFDVDLQGRGNRLVRLLGLLRVDCGLDDHVDSRPIEKELAWSTILRS